MLVMQPFTMVDTEIAMPNREEEEFWHASYWDAVASRDRSMDGVFFYAVISTGIYCRPSCPSKRPRRENVVFFRAREAAERAGFRACKRCKPDSADQRDSNAQLVEKVCRYIDTHPDEPVTLEALGRALGISPFLFAAHVQGAHRNHAARVRRFAPLEFAQGRTARGTFGDALALRRGLRIFQQALRTRHRTIGDDAFALSQARRRRDHSLRGCANADRQNVAGGNRARQSAPSSSEMRPKRWKRELRSRVSESGNHSIGSQTRASK